MTMTEDQRVALRAVLDEFDKADRAIDAAMAPFRTAQSAITEARETFLEQHGAEVRGSCEGCSAILLVGDTGHVCVDDELLCESCAPTYGDISKQMNEAPDSIALADRDAALEAVDAHLDAGGSLLDKAVGPL